MLKLTSVTVNPSTALAATPIWPLTAGATGIVAGVVVVFGTVVVVVAVVVVGAAVVVVVVTASFCQISFFPTFLQTKGFFLVPARAPALEQFLPTLCA